MVLAAQPSPPAQAESVAGADRWPPPDASCAFRIETSGALTALDGFADVSAGGACAAGSNFVTADRSGSLYLVNRASRQVRRISVFGFVATAEGSQMVRLSGDREPSPDGANRIPIDVAVDPSGALHIAGPSHRKVWTVTPEGRATMMGSGRPRDAVDLSESAMQEPAAIAVTHVGNVDMDSPVLGASLQDPAATNPPHLTISKSPMSSFVEGHRGASYGLQVMNTIGAGTTSGTVTVTDVPAANLTLRGMKGIGWQCTGNTCTRGDALLAGNIFPDILVSVDISPSAPSQVSNSATVSGGGSQSSQTVNTAQVNPGPPNVLPAPLLVSPANGATGLSVAPHLAWTAVSGALNYILYVSTSPDGLCDDPYNASTVPGTPDGLLGVTDATDIVIRGLRPGATYYWHVRGAITGGGGEWSDVRSFTTTAIAPLSAPTLIAPNDHEYLYDSPATFGWTPVAGATGYRLMIVEASSNLPVDPDAVTCAQCAVNVTTPVPSYSLPALQPGYWYWWAVRAFNASQGGYWSSWRVVGTRGTEVAPTLSSPANGATGISIPTTFIWSSGSTGTRGFRIMVALSASALPADVYTSSCPACVVNTTTSTTSYTTSVLQPGVTYYWRVRAASPFTGGQWPPIRSFTVGGAPLVAPSQLSPVDGAVEVPRPVELRWNTVGGATGYRVAVALQLSTLPTSPDVTVCNACDVSVTSLETSLFVGGLAGGEKYYWKVAAYNGVLHGSWSSAFSFTTRAASSVQAGGFVNAASFTAPVAPGSLAAVFGNFAVPSPALATGPPFPVTLGGLDLQFGGGIRAPLLYSSSGRVVAQVPWELAGQSHDNVTVFVEGQSGPAQALSLAPVSPAIFSVNGQGTGQGAILDQRNWLVDASHPATAGTTVVQVFCTGLGAVTHQPATGAPAPLEPLSETTTRPTVTIGGAQAEVVFSGLVPGLAGLYQVNAVVPAASGTGASVPLTISIGGVSSNIVTLAVRSVDAGP